jgi:hypothetical protein
MSGRNRGRASRRWVRAAVAVAIAAGVGLFGPALRQAEAATIPSPPDAIWLPVSRQDATSAEVEWRDRSTNETSFVVYRIDAFADPMNQANWTHVASVTSPVASRPRTGELFTARIPHDSIDTYCVIVGARNADGTGYRVDTRPYLLQPSLHGGGATHPSADVRHHRDLGVGQCLHQPGSPVRVVL